MSAPTILTLQWQGQFVTATFSAALNIATGHENAPWTATINAVPVAVVGVTKTPDPSNNTQYLGVVIQLGSIPTSGSDVVAVAFNNSGTGAYYTAASDATPAADKTSTAALWATAYPQSTLQKLTLTFNNGNPTAGVAVYLSATDTLLVREFGPMLIDTHVGPITTTCGTLTVLGNPTNVQNGTTLTTTVIEPTVTPSCRAAAALVWEDTMVQRIQTAIIAYRTMNTITNFGANTNVVF